MKQLFTAIYAIAMAVTEGSRSGGRTLRTMALILTFTGCVTGMIAAILWLVSVVL